MEIAERYKLQDEYEYWRLNTIWLKKALHKAELCTKEVCEFCKEDNGTK